MPFLPLVHSCLLLPFLFHSATKYLEQPTSSIDFFHVHLEQLLYDCLKEVSNRPHYLLDVHWVRALS